MTQALAALLLALAAAPAAAQVAPFVVTGDAVEAPLDGLAGDAGRGARIVRNRETANCLICHTIPDPRETFMGEVEPKVALLSYSTLGSGSGPEVDRVRIALSQLFGSSPCLVDPVQLPRVLREVYQMPRNSCLSTRIIILSFKHEATQEKTASSAAA